MTPLKAKNCFQAFTFRKLEFTDQSQLKIRQVTMFKMSKSVRQKRPENLFNEK